METWWRWRWRWRSGSEKWFFWLILVVHGVAILIFTKGFLLTRTELPFYSHCSDAASQSPCFSNSNSNSSRCWTKPSIDRLVIIVLDALRYFLIPISLFLFLLLLFEINVIFLIFRFDFVAPSTFFEG
jgi:phosphatidylinositol glycan class O